MIQREYILRTRWKDFYNVIIRELIIPKYHQMVMGELRR